MARGFADGFQSGFGMMSSLDRKKRDDEEFELRKKRAEKEFELTDQQIEAGRHQARVNSQVDEETAGIRSYMKGEANDNSSDRVEAQRLGVQKPDYQGTPAFKFDPSNLEHQAGLNQRMSNVAAIKGDFTALQSLQQRNAELGDMQAFNKAVQEFSTTGGQSMAEYTRWVNKTNPMVSAAPAIDPRSGQLTGYNIMTVTPSGDAVYKFISPQQAATLAGATALMERNPTKALQLIGTVDQALAGSIQQMNTTTKDVTTTGNTATHFGNQDATSRMNAESQRITANATASRANQEKKTPSQQADEKIQMYAGILMRQDPNLTKEQADKKAADIILRDPNAKEQDVGLSEAGIFRKGGKYFTMGKGGKPEEVKFPGESKLDKALEAYAKGGKGAASSQDDRRPFFNTPVKELQRIAKKPRGVSSAEAAAAEDELQRRQGESRIGPIQ
jgi:hypothetical protein